METKEHLQINILKGIAIVFVVILHSFVGRHLIHGFFISGLHIFLINQCVWIFYVIMGLVMGLSLRRNNAITLKELYSKRYFKNRISKVIYPFLFCFLLSAILGLLFYNIYPFMKLEPYFYFGMFNLLGRLPTGGFGNYYILIIIQFSLVFPLIYKLYLKKPKWTIIGSFIACFLFMVLFDLYYSIDGMEHGEDWKIFHLYSGCILRGLPAFVLGLWISYEYQRGYLKNLLQKNKFVIIGFIFSFTYLMLYWLINFQFEYFEGTWGFRNIFNTFYPVIFVLLGLEYLPEKSKKKITNFFATLGKTSYHIFLIQMFYFVFFKMDMRNMRYYELGTPMYIIFWWILFIVNITGAILCGLAFYFADKKIRQTIRKRIIKKTSKESHEKSMAITIISLEKKYLERPKEAIITINHQFKQFAEIS